MTLQQIILDRFSNGVIGGFCGGVLGFTGGLAIAIIQAPVHDPAQPLANEWYTLAVFAALFGSTTGGAIVGFIDGLLRRRGFALRSLMLAMFGAVLGVLIAQSLPKTAPERALYRSVAWGCSGAMVSVLVGRAATRSKQADRISDLDQRRA